jgi:hypothetical protein
LASGAVGAVGAENGSFDADLQSLIDRWPTLPDAIKASVMVMIHVDGGSA